MIITAIDVCHVLPFKPKNNAPICPNSDAPKSGKIAFQRMQSISRQIKIFRLGRLVERRENAPDFFDMLLIETAPVVILIKAAQTAMLKTKNHNKIVK